MSNLVSVRSPYFQGIMLCFIAVACYPSIHGHMSAEQPVLSSCESHLETDFLKASLLQVSPFPYAIGQKTNPLRWSVKVHLPQKEDVEMLVTSSEPSGGQHAWLQDIENIPSWLSRSATLAFVTMEAESRGWRIAVILVLVIPLLFGIVLWLIFHFLASFENAVARSIKNFAHLDVDIGSLKFYPHSGYIEILDFLIKNPEPFKNDDHHWFLKAKVLRLDIGMQKAIFSLGKDIHIDEMTAANMEVIIEYQGYFGGESNVSAILKKISGDEEGEKAEEKTKETPKQPDPDVAKDKAKNETTPTKVSLHQVCFENIGMRLETKLAGGHVSAGDINYEDFSEEVGDTMLDDIVCVLLKSIAKTLLEHMAGQSFANKFLKASPTKHEL